MQNCILYKHKCQCVNTASLCIFIATAILLHVDAVGREYVAIDELSDGQCYGDTVHYAVVGTNPAEYYELISETNFLEKLENSDFFLYTWSSTVSANMKYFSIDANTIVPRTSSSDATKAIESAKLPVFSSCSLPGESRILGLFSEAEINSGRILAVVDRECTIAYDMTPRLNEYAKRGSRVEWDGVYYETASGYVTGPSSIQLTDIGARYFLDDMVAGRNYISAKSKEEKESERTLPDTTLSNATETVSFTNSAITAILTNSTVIVDPHFKSLKSILKFKYPKYATEGDRVTYWIERMGACYDPLTVHVVTNGYWCANVTWAANEFGSRGVSVSLPVSEGLDGNEPFEVTVKTLESGVVAVPW